MAPRKTPTAQGRFSCSPCARAALIAFVASDDAEMITGQMILCDGGGYLH